MNFGQALEALKQDKRIYRSSWDGVGMWLELEVPNLFNIMTIPYIYIEYTGGTRYPWTPSQIDMLAEDWIIEGEENA